MKKKSTHYQNRKLKIQIKNPKKKIKKTPKKKKIKKIKKNFINPFQYKILTQYKK